MNINNDTYRVNHYLRDAAVNYATAHALLPNASYRYFPLLGDGGGDCSNFISQCLHAGGAPMDFGSISPWWYKGKGTSKVNDDIWSVSWAVAHSLYWTLKVRYERRILGLKAVEVPDMGELEIGDLIQYERGRGFIYHSAIVTSFTDSWGKRVPLITQHTYNALNISHIKPAASKMHFMKIIVN